jgi:dephospho-CoA kinase
MIRVGLTGGIGSGKTVVANRFERLGTPVIDSDIITRELVVPGSLALKRIIESFGEDIVDAKGNLDRQKLRQTIFADHTARRNLEEILHPMVRQEIARQLSGLSSPYALVVIPLMVESGMVGMFDRVIVVDCDEEEQIKRVIKRDSCSKDEVDAIIQTQTSRNKRLAIATDIINNTVDIRSLDGQVERMHQHFLSLA